MGDKLPLPARRLQSASAQCPTWSHLGKAKKSRMGLYRRVVKLVVSGIGNQEFRHQGQRRALVLLATRELDLYGY